MNSPLHFSTEFTSLLTRINDIADILSENAEKSEEIGRLTEESVQALHQSGVFKIGIPNALGGYEFSPTQTIKTIARVSYADASAGWTCMALQMITGTTAAYLGHKAVLELFPNAANEQYALIAGQGTKMGTAAKVDGGYLLSGRWSFASGSPLASYIHTAARCDDTEQNLMFTVPKSQVDMVDNWDVMGLKATASHDYVIKDIFIPDNYVYEITTNYPRHGGALYRIGIGNMIPIAHTGWALGVGRRLLDEMQELALRKTGSTGASVDTGQFYAEYAQAETRIRSARAWALQVWEDNESTLNQGELLSTDQETLTRMALINATEAAREVGQTVYKWAASSALRRGVIQRFFRDLHAGTQHITSGPVALQNCGKQISGLVPNSYWDFISLKKRVVMDRPTRIW